MSESIFDASVDEITSGYRLNETLQQYECLICEKGFEYGRIFPIEDRFYEAKKAVQYHVQQQHGSMFDYLVSMEKKDTGLSDHQKELLTLFNQGVSDKEIAKETKLSASTIRNHRFKLREKEKQAKIFLALMQLLNDKQEETKFIPIHKGATMVDDRYAITEEERQKVIETYFKYGLNEPISNFPSKEKRKIIVLQQIMTKFEKEREYTEKEVNDILKKVYSDHVTIRRYLIEYGFMDRSNDCKTYWVKG